MPELFEVISVCNSPDAKTWAIAAPRIMQFISAQNYKVIVPDHEVEFFKSISPIAYQVLPETKFISNWQALLASHHPPLTGRKYGWYLQQFIKLAAAAEAPENSNMLIWDADTIPLRPLNFMTEAGKLNYYTGHENHRPYFVTIEKILSLKKQVDFSFIAQCFPTKSTWVKELFSELEETSGLPWECALIAGFEMRLGSQFSEYETLGTFLTHRHCDEMAFSQNKWARLGNSLIKNPENIDESKYKTILTDLDYISFEKWDNPAPSLSYKLKKKIRVIYNTIKRRILAVNPHT